MGKLMDDNIYSSIIKTIITANYSGGCHTNGDTLIENGNISIKRFSIIFMLKKTSLLLVIISSSQLSSICNEILIKDSELLKVHI